ncbi:MAG: NADH-quinone oxidoreductase subunit J [Parachlamydiales bacterium]|jgi:NADH-quinone oxidoreductase subunit J
MPQSIDFLQVFLGIILILSALGVVLFNKPVHACLSFLLTLLTLSVYYLQLSAHFVAVMQILVYAGAILVIFMFIIILFQDAYQNIEQVKAKSAPLLLAAAGVGLILSLIVIGKQLWGTKIVNNALPEGYGTVQSLGKLLYIDFFLPFEAITLLFLIAVIGGLYIGKKVKNG